MAGNNSHPGRSMISKIGLILQAVAEGSGNSLTEIAARSGDAVLGRALARFSPQTVTSPDRLRWDLRTVRRTRIALCDRELDGRTRALAAPVLGADGEVVAAVELAVRDLTRDVPRLTGPLAVAAGALSRDLGRAAAGAWEADGSPLRPAPDPVRGRPVRPPRLLPLGRNPAATPVRPPSPVLDSPGVRTEAEHG